MNLTKFFIVLSFFFVLSPVYSNDNNDKNYLYYINLFIDKNNSLKAQQEKLNNARWNKISYIGNILPQASIIHTRTYNMNNNFDETGWNSTLSVKQILFAGFSALNTIFMAGSQEGIEEFTLAYKKLLVSEQAAGLYFKCAALYSQIESLNSAVDLMQQRINELKRRENLGKARISEVYSAQAKLAQLKSQLIQAQLDYENSMLEFENQCGEKPSSFIYPDSPSYFISDTEDIENYVNNYPYIKAMKQQLNYYESVASVKKGSFLPSVSLLADYTLGSSNYKSANPAIKLMANWDIFSGGNNLAETIAAEALISKAKYELEDARKIIYTQIKKAINNYNFSVKKLKELKEYYSFNQKNLNEQQRDYLLGNVTNLEVLQAMMDLKDAKIAYDSGRISAIQNEYVLKLWTGDIK